MRALIGKEMNTHDKIELSAKGQEILGLVDTLVASVNEAHHARSEGWRVGCFQAADETYQKIKAELAAIEADRKRRGEPVAEDWQYVPSTPTDEMLRAGQNWCTFPHRVYAAMVEAAPQAAEPSEGLPRHVAQTLANAIYETAQKMGIANGDHTHLSVAQCLHLLDCMSQPAEPVSYWLCCGSTDPLHRNRRQPDCYSPDRAKFGTAESHRATPAEPVKVPSLDEIMDAVLAYGRAQGMRNVTTAELNTRWRDIRALIARYGQPAQPATCQGTNCGATDGVSHSPECILEAAEAQGWADSPEAEAARRQIAAQAADEVDKSENLQGTSVDRMPEMQSKPATSAEPFGHVWRASDTTAVIKLAGDPRIRDGMPVYTAPVAAQPSAPEPPSSG